MRINLTGKPSNVHVNWGGGFPVATHFNDTVGPGWRVCSENQYNSSGDASNWQFEN